MTLTADIAPRAFGARATVPQLLLPGVLALTLVLCVPLFIAQPADLTSDESLYLAEAYNIAHGEGLTYPSGDPITHRAPLHALLLAPAVWLGGPDAAYAVSKVVVAVNAALVMLLAWRLSGVLAGAIGGGAAAVSAYAGGLGTTLYVDPLQCTFLLLALAAPLCTLDGARLRWFATAGALTGLAFLVKESAIQWAPLGLFAWLAISGLRTRTGARGALWFSLAFCAVVAPWFAWVWAHTSTIFLLGKPGWGAAAIFTACTLGMAGLAVAAYGPRRSGRPVRAWPMGFAAPAAAGLIAGWSALIIYGLETRATWPYSNAYWSQVPEYLATVAPLVQPFFLVAAAWTWAAVRARRDPGLVIVLGAAVLFAPFAIFAANRGLQLRDALPLVYISYVLLGVAAVDGVRAVMHTIARPASRALVCVAIFVTSSTFVLHEMTVFRSENSSAGFGSTGAADWDNRFERDIAAWMEQNLPAGARVLTSRLYFSSLHVDTGARFEIRQMPTVRVEVDPSSEGLLAPRSNLFRWGDLTLRGRESADSWLYLRQFPEKGYWIALSEQELLDYLQRHSIDHVILTGDDYTFSTLAYAAYFGGHPAFRLLHHDAVSAADQVFVYSVDRARLLPQPHSTAVSPSGALALERESGLSLAELSAALGTPLRVTDGEAGLSAREQRAALEGVDLGLKVPAGD